MGSKGSGPTTQNVAQTYMANPAISGAANQAISGAEGAAAQPFQMPVAPVAQLTADQLQSYNNVNTAQGFASPLFAQAAGAYSNAAAPINTNDINAFYNPMAANVTAQMQNIFGQQNVQNQGTLTQNAGGVGADRIAVGMGNLANQQGLAAGQTYANLYQQAVQAAEFQKQQESNAGAGFTGLGTAGTQNALNAANSLNQMGVQQQAQQQTQLNAPYQNLLARIAYQFQTPQYLAGITGGLAPALGGTTAGNQINTPGQPSALSQILGIGTAGAGIYGALGGFGGGSGSLSQSALSGDAPNNAAISNATDAQAAQYEAMFGSARGGKVEGFDVGGMAGAPIGGMQMHDPGMLPPTGGFRPAFPPPMGGGMGMMPHQYGFPHRGFADGGGTQEPKPVQIPNTWSDPKSEDTIALDKASGVYSRPDRPVKRSGYPRYDEGGGTNDSTPPIPGVTLPKVGGLEPIPFSPMPMGAGHSGMLGGQGVQFSQPQQSGSGSGSNSIAADIGAAAKVAALFMNRGGSPYPKYDDGGGAPDDNFDPSRPIEGRVPEGGYSQLWPFNTTHTVMGGRGEMVPYPAADSSMYSPEERGDSPLVNKIQKNLQDFSNAKPPSKADLVVPPLMQNPLPKSATAAPALPTPDALEHVPLPTPNPNRPLPTAAPAKPIKVAETHSERSPSGGSGTTDTKVFVPPYPDATDRDWGQNLARSPWMALIKGGAQMASTVGPPGVALAHGISAGAGALDAQRKELRSEQELNDKAQALYNQTQQHLDKYNRMTANEKAVLAFKYAELNQTGGEGGDGIVKPMTAYQRSQLYGKIDEAGRAQGWSKDQIDQEYRRRLSMAGGLNAGNAAPVGRPPTSDEMSIVQQALKAGSPKALVIQKAAEKGIIIDPNSIP